MSHQLELFESCLSELKAGRSVVRAVILQTWGSTPREVGADMILDLKGGLKGTVGGGCGEAEVYDVAQELLHAPESAAGTLLHVDLTESPEDGGEKVCGGRFDVLLHRLSPKEHQHILSQVVSAINGGEALTWQTDLGQLKPGFWKEGRLRVDFHPGLSLVPATDADTRLKTGPAGSVFTEPIGQVRKLIIVGAGHIARPLCVMAAQAGYQVHVIDDREEYAQEDFFPSALAVHCGRYQEMLLPLVTEGLSSVVLVTRGHRHDQECLRLIAHCRFEYLGMIGSQRRIDAVFEELMEEGVERESLERVCAPIGLEIGAQTPAEIAISILAEMILHHRRPEKQLRSPPARQRRIRSLS
jgi:xanthine dehydrogenase accessory factor